MKKESLKVKQWREKNKKLCPDCKKIYILPESKTCKDCSVARKSELSKKNTISDVIKSIAVKNKHPSWLFARIRTLCRSWNKEMTKLPCQNCGYSKHVELCHIRSISNFNSNTKLEIVNNKDNIVQLCRNCHWEFDHKLLKFDSLLSRKEENGKS